MQEQVPRGVDLSHRDSLSLDMYRYSREQRLLLDHAEANPLQLEARYHVCVPGC